jgi:predicted Zn-ribbon and HTH transcriptional regulator
MKSTTIWISLETKKRADKLKGNKSYNKHYEELMDMYERGLLNQQPASINIENIIKKIKEAVHNEIVESLSMTGMNPLFYERIRHIIRQEIQSHIAVNYSYCRNCGYPVISGNYTQVTTEKKKPHSIFTMLI